MKKMDLKTTDTLLNKVKRLLGYQEKVPLKTLLKETIDYYENIIGCMPGNVYWLDKNGITVGCNQNVLTMFGMKSSAEFEGLNFADMARIGHWSEVSMRSFRKDTLEVINTGKPRLNIEEPPIPDASGKLVYFLTHRVPLFDQRKNIVGIVGISIDITQRKQLEIEIHKAKNAAEAANQAKTEFIANMSHDIRTPLTGVIGISNILQQLVTNPEFKQYAHDIHHCGQQLLNMLNSILDVVSADHVSEQDKILETFNLHQCIQDIISLEKPTATLKNLEVITSIDPAIPSYLINDKTKIHRILLNLFSNAVKFTETGSITLKAQLSSINHHQANVLFSITDTGIGVPKNQQDKVFDRFFRASPSYKEAYSGHGVGLHIAQSYARLLGSEIKLISEEGVGTTFYFAINSPIDHTEKSLMEIQATGKPSNTNIKNPKCLLIEDNPIALKVLESIVASTGLEYVSKTDGESALKIIESQFFDLIITDIGLPGVSGNDFAKTYRQWEKTQHKPPIPIIALTAHAHNEVKIKCQEAGINTIYSKPFSMEAMHTILSTYLHTPPHISTTAQAINDDEKLGLDLPNTEETLFLLDKLPILDIQKALSFIGNNKNTLKDILTTMANQAIPIEKIQLETAHHTQDWDALEKLAHKIKSGAAYVGAEKLKMACQYLERYRKAGHHQSLELLYQQMMRVIEETRQAIIQWLP